MTERTWELFVPASVEAVWEFHESDGALKALTPPERHVRISGDAPQLFDGALHCLRGKVFGIFPFRWDARISEVERPFGFTDTAERSPFKSWVHRHQFEPAPGGTVIRDTVRYEVGFGPLGRLLDRLLIRGDLDRLWRFRHAATLAAITLEDVDAGTDAAISD